MRTDELNLKIKAILGEGAKKVLVRMLFPWRNSFLLFNISDRAKKNRVNLNYWNESDNLGDTLSPVIVNYMLQDKGIGEDQRISECRHLYAVGSVLTAGIQDATVWGSGILNTKLCYRLENRKLDVRAVRGPVTRAMLMDYGYEVPQVYGDPAILLPEIYTPANVKKTHRFGLIAHKDYDLSKAMQSGSVSDQIKMLNIRTADYRKFVDELNSVETVISSSLHGLILAEAYGIPAVLLKPQIDIVKYSDYYYSTGRIDFPVANTVEEAFQIRPAEVPDMSRLRKELKSAFPYDLYRQK